MVSCSSCAYTSTPKAKDSGVSFHKFPNDKKTRIEWIKFVKKLDFIPKSRSVLCSHHFTEECFDRSSKLKIRLLPNAIPTIEVERLKCVRRYKPVLATPMKCVEKLTGRLLSMPGSSGREQSHTPPVGIPGLELEDTPRKKHLHWKMRQLQKTSILKSLKIRKLQKINCRQKKQISSLKALTLELKNKNLLLEENHLFYLPLMRRPLNIIGYSAYSFHY